MHGFIRQLPEYRQAKSRGEREERERVLRLIRQRTTPARAEERRLAREMEADAKADATANAKGNAGTSVAGARDGGADAHDGAEQRTPIPAERRAEARGAVKILEELQKAVGYGWQR